jgi:hypothetical protein
MEPFETYEHAGVTVELHYDEGGFNPRKDFDHAGTIVSFTRDFDADEYLSVEEDLTYDCPKCDGEGEVVLDSEKGPEECPDCDNGTVYATVEQYMRHEFDDTEVVIPLRFEDYGSRGSKLVTTDSDNNPNAAIYLGADMLATEWEGDREKARKCLEAEVEEMSSYLSGEVYGYVIKGPGGEDLPDNMQDSCWGFIGDSKYVREEANRAADGVAESLAEEVTERDEMACRGIETRESVIV